MSVFGFEERRIGELMSKGNIFKWRNESYIIENVGKPTCARGEPKTDIYVYATNLNRQGIELKISFKKENADFLENKINEERAEQLFGPNWEQVIVDSTMAIKENFFSRYLVHKQRYMRTEKGAITLGWKFELLNRSSGKLSGAMNLDKGQVMDVYAGVNLSSDKKDADVNGIIIDNSGIANYMLMNEYVYCTQDVVDNLIPIEEYVKLHPNIYFACKALNYRTYTNKWDGDRPLAVFVDWKVEDGKLVPGFVFNCPLSVKGDKVAFNLINCMNQLGIRNTDDININNICCTEFVCGL